MRASIAAFVLPRSIVVLLACAALTVPLAGCGAVGGADGSGVRLLVTRDFGARQVGARIVQDVSSSESASDLLARSFGVDAHADDWFLYVNGVEREAGADDGLHDGDRIWWDRHETSAARRVPAVVGSFPEPFAHGAQGKRYPVVLECDDDAQDACSTVADRLGAAGVIAARQTLGTGVGEKTLRVLVGRWSVLREDQALEQIDRGPAASGVYARFGDDGALLELLDAQGRSVRALGPGAGLVAATRFEQQAPTWAITGTDAAGVAAAAQALDERSLQRRFALALDGPRAFSLPLVR
jgi:hypothetical protein